MLDEVILCYVISDVVVVFPAFLFLFQSFACGVWWPEKLWNVCIFPTKYWWCKKNSRNYNISQSFTRLALKKCVQEKNDIPNILFCYFFSSCEKCFKADFVRSLVKSGLCFSLSKMTGRLIIVRHKGAVPFHLKWQSDFLRDPECENVNAQEEAEWVVDRKLIYLSP